MEESHLQRKYLVDVRDILFSFTSRYWILIGMQLAHKDLKPHQSPMTQTKSISAKARTSPLSQPIDRHPHKTTHSHKP